MPIRLNYSLKYEGLVLKIEIISIELENKSNVLLNPYVRIELIKNNADGENTNTNSAFEFDSNDIDPLNQSGFVFELLNSKIKLNVEEVRRSSRIRIKNQQRKERAK